MACHKPTFTYMWFIKRRSDNDKSVQLHVFLVCVSIDPPYVTQIDLGIKLSLKDTLN